MPSQRVIHVVEGLEDRLGGLPTAVIAMADAQARGGVHVEIVYVQRGSSEPTGLDYLDRTVKLKPFRPTKALSRFHGSLPMLSYLWRRSAEVDLIHVHAIWSIPSFAGSVIAAVRRKRLIVSPHGSLEKYDTRKHGAAKRLLGPLFIRPVLSRSEAVLCTSVQEADGLTTYGARVARVVLALPPNPIAKPTMTPREFLGSVGVPDGVDTLLFLGRLDPKKGVEHAIDALAFLGPQVHLVIAGGGERDYEMSLRERARAAGIDDRAHFIGWASRTRKADALSSATLFVLLSHNENYGITPVEAAQAGLPSILTSDVYSSTELVQAGAAVLSSRDPRHAADVIQSVLSDRARLAELRRGCLEVFGAQIDRSEIASDYVRLVDSPRERPGE